MPENTTDETNVEDIQPSQDTATDRVRTDTVVESGHSRRRRGNAKGTKYKKTSIEERYTIEREEVIKRQRRDCKRLSRIIEGTLAKDDKGAGSAGEAAAVGQLTRAQVTLHGMEADVYGLKAKDRGITAIMLIPAKESMEAWQAASDLQMGKTGTDDDSGPLRLVEDDVVGQPDEGGGDE